MNDCPAKDFPYQKIFLVFGLIFGLAWLLLIPPFQGPDEFTHFYRAYMLSEGQLRMEADPHSGRIGYYLPASIKELESTLQSHKIAGAKDVKQDLGALAEAAKIATRPEARLFYDNIAYYPPVAYAPYVAGITLARIANLPILYVFYAARLGGLIFFLGTMWFLIKHLRILKLPLLTMALMPISIQQGFIIGADCVTIVLILMLVCYVINMTFYDGDKLISAKNITVFYLLCALLALTKGPYVVLALLYFVIPKERFSSSRTYWACGIGMIVAGIFLMAAWKLLQTDLSSPTAVNSIIGVTPGKDTNPFHILYRVYFKTMFSIYLYKSAFWLGWMDVRLPFIFLATYTSLMFWPLFIADAAVDKRAAGMRKTGFVIIALIFCIWTAYHISMYLAEVQKPEGKILGMQGRYFVRLLFPLLVGVYLAIPGKWRLICSKLPWSIGTQIKIHLVLLALFLAAATWYICARYY